MNQVRNGQTAVVVRNRRTGDTRRMAEVDKKGAVQRTLDTCTCVRSVCEVTFETVWPRNTTEFVK